MLSEINSKSSILSKMLFNDLKILVLNNKFIFISLKMQTKDLDFPGLSISIVHST